ncbi:ATP-dependent protease La [Gilbertella persicaria]|uniref:ATP-dependent protease La n=1 Tax=Gilbertella persicaria TaxID=101096 RepID=UPI0022210EE2|nr:ATP-dependent protease La [Gilbertella persicaria]KAI8059945.1 ATP-dependent protease La [Gilbertella persicaria]
MRAIGVSPSVLDQFRRRLERCHVSHAANLLLCVTDVSKQDKLRVLEIADMKERLYQVNQTIRDYLQTIKITASKSDNDMLFDQIRRKFYLLQERASIYRLTEDDEETIDLVIKLNHAKLPEHAAIAIKRDLNRLRKLPPSSSDAAVIKTYIEYVSELPWSTTRHEDMQELHISSVKHQLDADHFGMDTVKNRILEYLSILKIKQDATPPILCFVGPPGVGKTTLGISIARALQRKFHRISLGGVRDEAEIRGHRRTYVGALPGLLIHGMRQCGVQNPVMLLDEIDKLVTNSNQGDPAAALLEVLDPAQNATFNDHFINIPYDLSQVVFIATANSLDTIPRPLLDRMEVIQLDGYTFHEKLHISQAHLVPKQIKAHGLSDVGGIELSKEVLLHIAERYTRESGVRQLERLIASVCRYKCKEYADLMEARKLDQFSKTIHVHQLEHILGVEPYENEVLDAEEIPGIINGLAYAGSGNGGVMTIEANCMPGTGQLKLTGSLGDIIKESAQLAVSWIKSNAYELKLTNLPKQDILKDVDLHIHMPSGAIPKDGPSAGITMTTCLVSLLSGHYVPKTTAMTGEITLRGQVRPVGGIKEKVISAHRAGVKKILLPIANRRDVIHDVPIEVQKEIQFVYCKSMWDVIEAAFDQIHTFFEPKYRCRL